MALRMSNWRFAVIFAVMVGLFLVANRGAYRGYFQDDDLDNLVQTRSAPATAFVEALASPWLSQWNFRPAGHGFYKIMGAIAGLQFRPYVAVLQGIHLLNVLLVWLLLRRLGAPPLAAAGGSLLFAFHMACFEAYWRPMYIFDVACAFWVLAALLLYLYGRWMLALIPFWIAYKTKEMAVMLPAALLLYEFTVGERRWRRVLPFAAISTMFIGQAVLANGSAGGDYTLRFSPAAIWTTMRFYSSQVLLIPFAGFALLLLLRDRWVRFGLGTAVLLLGPMWFLPTRLFAVYLYIPLIGLAIAFAFLAARWRPVWLLLFFAVWIPWNYLALRARRPVELAAADDNRRFVAALEPVLRQQVETQAVAWEGRPQGLRPWGVEGAVRWFLPDRSLAVTPWPEAPAVDRLLLIQWDPATRTLGWARRWRGDPLPAEIVIARGTPEWLLGTGWYPREGGYRWTGPAARVRLRRPAEARAFYVRVNVGPVQFREQGAVELEVLVNGQPLGLQRYDRAEWAERRWAVPADPAEGDAEVTIRAVRPYRPSNGDPRELGAAVTAFGFVAGQSAGVQE